MAARFLVAGGNGNWTSATNWATTSGGASGATAPTTTDDVTFDSNSGATNITIDTSARTILTWAVTSGYTGTITFTNALTVSGATTLGANMGIAGAAALTLLSGNITSSGKTWPNALNLITTGGTATLVDNWTAVGTVTIGNSVTTVATLNGSTLTCNGSVTSPIAGGSVSGTTAVVMNGTGTFSTASATTGFFKLSVEINTAGTVTLTTVRYGTGTLKFTAGTLVTTSFNLTLAATTVITCNMSGVSMLGLYVTVGNLTYNGSSGFSVGTFSQLVAGGTHTFTSGNTYNITSSFVVTATSASRCAFVASTGSSAFYLNYSGSTLALAYVNATDVNSSGGSAIYVYTGTLLRTTNWTDGTVIGSGSGGGTVIVIEED